MLRQLRFNSTLFIAGTAGVFMSHNWWFAGVAAFMLAGLLRNAEDDV